jgi:hypothetical protein
MNKYFKDNENWLLVLKIVPVGVSRPLGPMGKLFVARGKKKFEPPWFTSKINFELRRCGARSSAYTLGTAVCN